MRRNIAITAAVALAGVSTLVFAAQSGSQRRQPAGIWESNVTNDIDVAPGEPQLAVDPTNPNNMAMYDWAVGSKKVPAATGKFFATPDPESFDRNGRVMLSSDGGKTWTLGPKAVFHPDVAPIAADPALAYGPDGTLYATAVMSPKVQPANSMDFSGYRVGIAQSRDKGRTFGKTELAPTAPHRPWIRVDQKTGKVYVGTFGFHPSVKDQADDSKQNGWIINWKAHLTDRSEPYATGGSDFGGAVGNHFAVANGVVAAVFLLGPPMIESMNRNQPESMPMPASLRPLVPNGLNTCSVKAPCLFFETSTDDGRSWSRHFVPLPAGGYSGIFPIVAADPSRRGRFTINFLSRDGMQQIVIVTDDFGKTWTAPYVIPESTRGRNFKSWMDYGPTGVLGLMWKKQRDDLPEAKQTVEAPGQGKGPAFDVYAAISCDGGKRWLPPVRVNAVTSPVGPNGLDDLSFIVLNDKAAHLAWGDRRAIGQVKNAPGGLGGLQTYYGHVPFAAVSKGARCGG